MKSICFSLTKWGYSCKSLCPWRLHKVSIFYSQTFCKQKDTVCAVVEYKIYDKCSYLLLSKSLGVSSLLLITHSQKLMKHQDWKINNCVLKIRWHKQTKEAMRRYIAQIPSAHCSWVRHSWTWVAYHLFAFLRDSLYQNIYSDIEARPDCNWYQYEVTCKV